MPDVVKKQSATPIAVELQPGGYEQMLNNGRGYILSATTGTAAMHDMRREW